MADDLTTHEPPQAEGDLRAASRRLDAVLANATMAIFLMDERQHCVYLNPAAERLTGYGLAELQDRELHDVIHHTRPDGRPYPHDECPLGRAVPDGAPQSGEEVFVHKDGSFYPVAYTASPVRDEAGEPIGTVIEVRNIAAEKAAEAALRESEEHHRVAVELNPQVAWTAPPDGQLDHVSRRWSDWTGGNGLGESWGKAIHPDDLAPTAAAWTRSITTGEPYDIEHRVRLRNGEYHWMRSRAQPRRDEAGRIIKWYGSTEDIHEQKLAEADLRASEARFRVITEAMPQIVWSTLPDGHHDFYNARWYEFTGVPAGSTDGEGWNAVFHPDDQPRAWAVWNRSLETGEPYEIEYRLRHHSGVYRWVLGRALPVRDEAGRIIRWLGTCTDIDDQVRAREMLAAYRSELERQVEERTRERDRIWNLSEDLFAVMGFDGYLKSVNPAWSRLLGYDEATLLSTHVSQIAHPDDLPRVAGLVEKLQAGAVVRGFEDRLRAADGRYVTISWTCSPAGDMFYATGRDVTREREREEQLRQAQKMEAVGQLTGGVAHDFNNLLQIVVGNLEILQRNLPADAARLRRSTDNAMQGARRAATLTERLLAFSRRQPLTPRPVEPNKLVAGMSELLARALDETIALETVLGAGIWRVEVDANQLEAAILNLAVNARDAMPEGGKLTVETSNTYLDEAYVRQNVEVAQGQYVVICVTDTGAGMEKEAVARAFEPFFTTKEVGKGTGLGLSQVYGFVKQSGGHVKIYSEPGEGTTVKIYLPRHLGEAVEEVAQEASATPEGVECVLVVEDDESVRDYTVEALRELGYRVLEATSGPSALLLLKNADQPVDLLFTDVVLPGGLNGEQLALQARELRPDLKVLFTTGYARNAIVHQGRLEAGVQLITKPFSYADLAARVRDILDGKDLAPRA
jgi:PAS domain S-box-containing protein